MGVPLVASTRAQATTWKAAELESVRMASIVAVHTRSLLRQLQVVHPLSLRVLTGGALAKKLGLSRKSRHLDLWSLFGQFQLSRVSSQHNLAESLTYNCSASGLHRLLLRLKMHTKPAEALALPTGLGLGEVASFGSSSTSFFIGALSKAPAMAQLESEQLLDEQLLGKETGKPIDLPELESALSNESLQPDELVAAYSRDSLQHQCLQQDELEAAYADSPTRASQLQHHSLQQKELAGTAFSGQISFQKKELEAAYVEDPTRVRQLQLQRFFRKSLWQLMLQEPWLNIADSSTRASQQQLTQSTPSGGDQVASALALSSTSPKHRTRTSHSFKLTSLLSIFLFILMVSSLTFTSLSFHTTSFLNGWAFELAQQDELLTTFGDQELENIEELETSCWIEESEKQSEIENQHELQNLLWDQELEELLAR